MAHRRGYAMLIQGGDKEISNALADGIANGMGLTSSVAADAAQHYHEGGGVVSAEIDRQRIADLLRVAMHPKPVDYAMKVYEAELDYGQSVYGKGAARRALDMLLVGWALVALGFERLFESVDGGR